MIFDYLFGFEQVESTAQLIYTVVAGVICAMLAVVIREGGRRLNASARSGSFRKACFSPLNFLRVAVMTVFTFCGFPDYRKEENRGKALLISLCGPAANLAACFAGVGIYRLFTSLYVSTSLTVWGYVAVAFKLFAEANSAMAMFNLLPIPNLDGGCILSCLMPEKLRRKWLSVSAEVTFFICFAVILILCRSGAAVFLKNIPINPAVNLFDGKGLFG